MSPTKTKILGEADDFHDDHYGVKMIKLNSIRGHAQKR